MDLSGQKCPVCATGELAEKIITEVMEYKGQKLELPNYKVYECANCGEQIVDAETIKNSEKKMTDFRRGVDGGK